MKARPGWNPDATLSGNIVWNCSAPTSMSGGIVDRIDEEDGYDL